MRGSSASRSTAASSPPCAARARPPRRRRRARCARRAAPRRRRRPIELAWIEVVERLAQRAGRHQRDDSDGARRCHRRIIAHRVVATCPRDVPEACLRRLKAAPAAADSRGMNRVGVIAAAGGAVAIGLAPVVPLLMLAQDARGLQRPERALLRRLGDGDHVRGAGDRARRRRHPPARPPLGRDRRRLHGHGGAARSARSQHPGVPDQQRVHVRGGRHRRLRRAARRRRHPRGAAREAAGARRRTRPRLPAERRGRGDGRVRRRGAAQPERDPGRPRQAASGRVVDRRRQRARLRRARAAGAAHVPADPPGRRPRRRRRPRLARDRRRHRTC